VREDIVKSAEERGYGERYADDEGRIGQGLATRRPCDMAHLGAGLFEVFSEFHKILLIKNPSRGSWNS